MNNKLLKEQKNQITSLERRMVNMIINNGGSGSTSEATNNIEILQEVANLKRYFPLHNDVGFDEVEDILERSSEEVIDCFVKALSTEGSPSYKEAVRRIMSFVIKEDLSILYSFQGHKGKRKFNSRFLSKIIIRAVQLCDSSKLLMTKEIEMEIAVWLAKSKERMKI